MRFQALVFEMKFCQNGSCRAAPICPAMSAALTGFARTAALSLMWVRGLLQDSRPSRLCGYTVKPESFGPSQVVGVGVMRKYP